MAVLPRILALLCVVKIIAPHPWPEYNEDSSFIANLVDSSWTEDASSTTTALDSARDDEGGEEEAVVVTNTADVSSPDTSVGSSAANTSVADSSTDTELPQQETSTPVLIPPLPPPANVPKKTWAEVFCNKVKQFLNFMGHKINDTFTFIQRLFNWLY